ncbi:MAG: hypothetical protein ACJ71J_05005 [Nitrososphaeraceae archaeon]
MYDLYVVVTCPTWGISVNRTSQPVLAVTGTNVGDLPRGIWFPIKALMDDYTDSLH